MTQQYELLALELSGLSSCDEEKMTVKQDFPLSAVSTFAIGGNARIICYPRSENELVDVIKAVKKSALPLFVAGNASNLLFADEGFDGVVVFTNRMKGMSVKCDRMTLDAGVGLTTAANFALKEELTGLEFVYGIPGTVGGALYMNCGAFGGEMSQIVVKSKYYNPGTEEITVLEKDDHCFGYRHSFYSDSNKIIIGVEIQLSHGNASDIKRAMDEHIDYRKTNQPLDYPSAGSVFKRYPGYYTSKLIEESGLKGLKVGNAAVSEKHAGFIINLGGATSDDVKKLIDIIKNKIFESYGIHIETEVIFVGDGTEKSRIIYNE